MEKANLSVGKKDFLNGWSAKSVFIMLEGCLQFLKERFGGWLLAKMSAWR